MPRKRKPSINQRNIAAAERFCDAVLGRSDDLLAATADLQETFANAAQRQATQTVAFLLAQFEEQRKQIALLEKQLDLHQRHLEQIDRILDEQARAHAIGE